MNTDSYNIAYEKYYKDWRENYRNLFDRENRCPQSDRTVWLSDGYRVVSKSYKIDEESFLSGSENELYDKYGKRVFAWHNVDDNGEFFALIHHKNGKHYLVFRIELYGYSVFEAESGKTSHYVPAKVHPKTDAEEQEEVYIWTDVNYDAKNCLLAVSGCFWGCSDDTFVIDFSDPLFVQPEERWLNVRTIIDPNFCRYNSISFVGWESSELLLRCGFKGGSENVRLSADRLLNAIK